MAKSKSKLTPTAQLNNREYNKQLRRIKRFITRAEKRGYQFAPNTIPQKPKNVTKASVRKLARLTPERLYEKAVYGGEATYGEIVSGTEGIKAERSARAKKAAQTRALKQLDIQPIRVPKVKAPQPEESFEPPYNPTLDRDFYTRTVISTWLAELQMFENGVAYQLLRAWFETVRSDNGDDATADMIQDGADHGYMLTWETVYNMDEARTYMAGMSQYIPDSGVLYQEELLDRTEFMARLNDAMEQNEDWSEPE